MSGWAAFARYPTEMYPASPEHALHPSVRPRPENASIAFGAPSPATSVAAPVDREAPSGVVDAALLAFAGRGDLSAFNELVIRHQDFLYALAVRTTRDPVLAEDALQDGLLHAFAYARSYRGGGSVRGWLARIVLNACRDAQRWHRRRRADPLPDEPLESTTDPGGDPHRALIRREQARLLEEGLGRLVAEQRVALLLHVAHGLEYVEIAEATGVAIGTVKSRIHRGRLALRENLVDHRDLFADAS